MNKKIFNFFEIAASTAVSKNDKRCFLLGAVGIRGDGTIVKALNSTTECPNRQVHAEFRLSKKLDSGAIVYVARIRLIDGKFGIARPCYSCMKVLISKKVKKIYYTISENEFGVINNPGQFMIDERKKILNKKNVKINFVKSKNTILKSTAQLAKSAIIEYSSQFSPEEGFNDMVARGVINKNGEVTTKIGGIALPENK